MKNQDASLLVKTFLIVSLLLALDGPAPAAAIRLSDQAAATVGRKIWRNESGETVEGLTAWNSGEDFASLGIGHFIWYPPGKEGPFDESFPKLIAFLRREGVELPAFLETTADCPWRNKAEFYRDFQSREMKALRELFARTVPAQTRFIIARLEAALPKMLAEAPAARHEVIRDRFYAVASTSQGAYALIDYVNFKGEGTLASERYRGEGWGLLQVLDGMNGTPKGEAAVQEFARSAKAVLTRRVENSPPERKEARWLAGWKHRLDTYLP